MNKCWAPVLESIFKFNAVIKAGLRKKFPPLLSTPNGMMVRLLLAGIFVAQLIVSPAQAEQILFTPENGLSGSSHGEGSIKGRAEQISI